MKNWIFDLDGTLVDSFGPYYLILEDLLGRPLSKEEKKKYIAMNPLYVFRTFLSQDQIPRAMSELDRRSRSDAAVIGKFKRIQDVFSILKQNDCGISIWTSRDKNSAQLILEHSSLAPFVDHFVSGDCVRERKPDPEGLLKIQDLYSCSKKDLVMIGDHEHDMVAAQAAGVYSVRASWHSHWKEDSCSLSHQQFYCDQEFLTWVSLSVSASVSS